MHWAAPAFGQGFGCGFHALLYSKDFVWCCLEWGEVKNKLDKGRFLRGVMEVV